MPRDSQEQTSHPLEINKYSKKPTLKSPWSAINFLSETINTSNEDTMLPICNAYKSQFCGKAEIVAKQTVRSKWRSNNTAVGNTTICNSKRRMKEWDTFCLRIVPLVGNRANRSNSCAYTFWNWRQLNWLLQLS